MNRRPPDLQLAQAIGGYLKYKVVEGLSPRTLASYQDQLTRFQTYLGDVSLGSINTLHIEDFLYWLRMEYQSARVGFEGKSLSPKTLYNYWVALKSFFTWAYEREFLVASPMNTVPKPKFNDKPIAPFMREDIEALLGACKHSRTAETTGRKPFTMQRQAYRRDRALTLFLLDTGLRASELCALRICDVNMSSGEVTVIQGAFAAGAQVSLEVQVGQNATPTTGAPKYSGEFIVESYKPVMENGAAVTFEASLKPATGTAPVWDTV